MAVARAAGLAAAFAALVAAKALGVDQSARVERVELARAAGELVADIELVALLSPPVENTLKSGLPVVVDLAIELRPAAGRAAEREAVGSGTACRLLSRYGLMHGSPVSQEGRAA